MIRLWMVALSFLGHVGVGSLFVLKSQPDSMTTTATATATATTKNAHPEPDDRIPIQALLRMAQSELLRIVKPTTPVAELTFGDWLLHTEFHSLGLPDKETHRTVLTAYHEFLYIAFRAIQRETTSINKIEKIRKLALADRGKHFCAQRSHMAELFIHRCGNVEATTRLLISALVDLNLKQVGDYELGLRLYVDNASPVYMNNGAKVAVDVSSGLVAQFDENPIYRSEIFYYAFIRFQQVNPRLSEALLLQRSPSGQPVWPNDYRDTSGEIVPRFFLSNLRFPDTGRTCFSMPIASTNAGHDYPCTLPPKNGIRLYHAFTPHTPTTPQNRYLYVGPETKKTSFRWPQWPGANQLFHLASTIPTPAPPTPAVGMGHLDRNPKTFLQLPDSPATDGAGTKSNNQPSANGRQSSTGQRHQTTQTQSGPSGEGNGLEKSERQALTLWKMHFESTWDSKGISQDTNSTLKDNHDGSNIGQPTASPPQNLAVSDYGLGNDQRQMLNKPPPSDLFRSDYNEDAYGKLKSMDLESETELFSHLTGILNENIFEYSNGHPRQTPLVIKYMEKLSAAEDRTVLPPVRSESLDNFSFPKNWGPWLGSLRTGAYKRSEFYLEQRFDFKSDLRNRIRRIKGRSYIAFSRDHNPPIYIEPLKVIFRTNDLEAKETLRGTPQENQNAFADLMHDKFFSMSQHRSPRFIVDFLNAPFSKLPAKQINSLLQDIERMGSTKNILDDLRESKTIFLVDRYGVPAKRFYGLFYDVYKPVFRAYSEFLLRTTRSPEQFVQAIEHLRPQERHDLFDVFYKLKKWMTLPFMNSATADLLTDYLNVDEQSLETLKQLWHRPFFPPFQKILDTNEWVLKHSLDLSQYQVIEIETTEQHLLPREVTKLANSNSNKDAAGDQHVVLIDPDILWFLTFLQNEHLVLGHFEIQSQFLRKLKPNYLRGMAPYLNLESIQEYKALMTSRPSTLGNLSSAPQLVAQIAKDHLNGQFLWWPSIQNQITGLVPDLQEGTEPRENRDESDLEDLHFAEPSLLEPTEFGAKILSQPRVRVGKNTFITSGHLSSAPETKFELAYNACEGNAILVTHNLRTQTFTHKQFPVHLDPLPCMK